VAKIRNWVLQHCIGRVLNLYAGPTVLSEYGLKNEIRNDLNEDMPAHTHFDALDCVIQYDNPEFDTIILDPPYAARKSMEMYNGKLASSFMMVKSYIPRILFPGGRVITLGYHSVSMGSVRNFEVESIAIFSHGGAIHDTIGTVEVLQS
jgi:tRNA G10  N-methylase Trm11